jgi:integrase
MATITKRGDSWFAQVRRKGFAPRYKSFKRKGDAQQWAREQEMSVDNGSAATKGQSRATIAQLLERYLREVTVHKKGAASERARIGKMQKAPLANLSLQSLTPAAVAAYRDARLQLVKPGTVRRELVILHHLIEVASKEWGLHAGFNPVSRITRPIVRDQRERRVEADELTRLRSALALKRAPDLSVVVEFALATAMRRGEILNLVWTDIDLDARVATVRESKSGWSRTVPLSEEAITILQKLNRTSAQVFLTTADAVKNGWARVLTKADVNGLRFHDLRHEAISRFFERGLSVAEVSHISGHRDLRTLSRYTHLRAEDIAKKLL